MDHTKEKCEPIKVAIVGTGMAGLVTAWLLHNDARRRYEVHIFESGKETSLDAASITVKAPDADQIDRIDVPMRAFTEGYYHHLKAMYDHLAVKYHVQPFVFSFARISNRSEEQFFIHASNNHQLPPRRPEGMSLISYLQELLFVLICYLWFSAACLLVPARSGDHDVGHCESLKDYLHRIRIPQYFVKCYLLPLMSAVTTCTHKELLKFPAKDIVDYKKCITSGRQLVVSDGVRDVQQRLLADMHVSYSTSITAVKPTSAGVKLVWKKTGTCDEGTEDLFDRVILAVPPNVVRTVFAPVAKQLTDIPTTNVETVVHRDREAIPSFDSLHSSQPLIHLGSRVVTSQIIHLRTRLGPEAATEATHVQPSGAMVTSCPLQSVSTPALIRTAAFTRVLRTPHSRTVVNEIFGLGTRVTGFDVKASHWRNGDDNVFLVGAWCWDGMVLLEGCVVSAIRVARTMGVDVSWMQS